MVTVPDINVLIYTHRRDSPFHEQTRRWWDSELASGETFLIPDIVIVGFVRIVTNPRIYSVVTPVEEASLEIANLLTQPRISRLEPSLEHFAAFRQLLTVPGVRGDLVTDAYIAALAIGSGARLATSDRDFSRFPGLQVVDPRVAGTAGS